MPSALIGVVLTTPTAGSISPIAAGSGEPHVPSGATATLLTPSALSTERILARGGEDVEATDLLLKKSANQMLVESAARPSSGLQNTSPQGEMLLRTSPEVVIRRS